MPIQADQLEFAWGVWAHHGVLWVAQHLGMQFGTVAAIYAWHRVGYLSRCLQLNLLMVPTGRCVDDFFGAGRAGVVLTGGVASLRTLSFTDSILFTQAKAAKYSGGQLREILRS